MVYLVITPQGLQDILATRPPSTPIWCGADALSEADLRNLGRGGVTRFTYALQGADVSTIQCALGTIADHHPGERIRIESA